MKVNAARFGERCWLPDGHAGECELRDTLTADRVTEAAPVPADPVMSPADTIRQALNDYLPDGFRDEDGVWHDGPVLQDALAALAALLAVGERDKAEIERLRKALDRTEDEWERAWELDRRQIARLTEVGNAAKIVADLNGEMRSTYGRTVTRAEFQAALFNLETVVSGARAVLADEEDAANG